MVTTAPSTASSEHWDLVISPQRGLFDLRLGLLWRYRDLIGLLVWRDFVAYYKQTILGPLWHIIQPLLTTLTFTVIFGQVANLPTDGLPKFLFYMAGTVIWNYFAGCVNDTSNTFITNAAVFGKVYFPRLAVPVAILFSKLIAFSIQFGIFLGFVVYFGLRGSSIHPNLWILFTPVLLLMMAGLGLGSGIIVSALTTRYRDLTQLVGFSVTLLSYGSSVIIPYSSVPPQYQPFLIANPMIAIVEAFRYAYLGKGDHNALHLLYSGIITVAILAIGIVLFTRVERTFMDTV